jgi:hypothetical protein
MTRTPVVFSSSSVVESSAGRSRAGQGAALPTGAGADRRGREGAGTNGRRDGATVVVNKDGASPPPTLSRTRPRSAPGKHRMARRAGQAHGSASDHAILPPLEGHRGVARASGQTAAGGKER